jgi:folate-binding protein YgfZ
MDQTPGFTRASGADPSTQVAAAREAVLAVPEGELAILMVTGKDRLSWLNGLLTCDLVKRAPGEARYGLAVARNGRVLADATVVVDDSRERVLLAVAQSATQTLRAHLEHYLVMEDAEVAPDTDAFEAWSLYGPRAGEVLAAAMAAGAIGGIVDRTGLGGAFVLAPAALAAPVRAGIMERALALGGCVGDDAGWTALRLERAIPRFGVDFGADTYPQEAALEKTAVSFDKGCYLGQEVVCMLEMRGHVKRKLAAVVMTTGDAPARGAAVADESGAAVGEVTSAGASPTLGKAVALAMVKRGASEPGKRLFVGGVAGEVVERPA